MKKLLILLILISVTNAKSDESKSKKETGATIQSNLSKELQNGKLKAKTICSACHGIDGVAASGGNSVIVPNLTAQHKDYLVQKLKDYKSGKIQHAQMTVIAGMLSEQDIENVSEWYSRIKIKIFDPNLVLAKPSK
ncbi:cytochrome c [Pelagibacteraceae bacterium]|jgi:cytochrome c553|nr:cytochrome c [Pelagibacteraceae bacterium]|tara:strand:+ start:208 stop:615 length:408 start_codon:yes stop_codon:yes gene_type:complete